MLQYIGFLLVCWVDLCLFVNYFGGYICRIRALKIGQIVYGRKVSLVHFTWNGPKIYRKPFTPFNYRTEAQNFQFNVDQFMPNMIAKAEDKYSRKKTSSTVNVTMINESYLIFLFHDIFLTINTVQVKIFFYTVKSCILLASSQFFVCNTILLILVQFCEWIKMFRFSANVQLNAESFQKSWWIHWIEVSHVKIITA